MKKIYHLIVLLLCVHLVEAQTWTVYEADVEPTAFDPAFSESNNAGTFTYGTIADPDDASNNLLSIKTDPSDPLVDKDNVQLRQYTEEDAVTVVLKARTVDLDNKGLLFDIDFRSTLSARFAIKVLNDGTYDIDKGGDGVVEDKGDWGFDATEWNIFRVTKNANVVNIYLNEDATPVFTLTAPDGVDGGGYWRFGDGWGSEDVDTQYDWVTWDNSGAYSPSESILPSELIGEKEIPLGDWSVYNADVEPDAFDPAFSESNNAGAFTYGTIADTYIPNNNLLTIKTDDDPASDKDNVQLRQYTDEDAVTVVLKARTVDLANKGLLFDIDFRSTLSARFAIKVLNDGTYDIDKGGDGVVEDKGDWGFDATEWNIFRITKEADVVNIYLNEDSTPVFTLTAPVGADGSGYWRFGDGWGSEDVDTQYDWVTWDYSGAYSPAQTRLPEDLVKPPLGDWSVYNADVEPTAFDPAFSESNNAGTFTYGTIADPDDASNNLLSIKTDLSDPLVDKDNVQLRQYTEEDAVTVVLKARTVDLDNKGLLFDIDFRSTLSARFAIKVLNDGTYDIDKGGDGVVEDKGDWGFDATAWNIFRVTKNANVVNIYLNEDATPVFTLTAPDGVDGGGYWRFGDGWGSEDVDTQYDWVTWDYSGAYAPDQARLPNALVGDEDDAVPSLKTIGSPDPLAQDLGFASDFSVESYTISGKDLSGDITITPPANFEVSLNETDWFTSANPLVVVQSGGLVEITTVFVRLNSAADGEYTGDIAHSSDGAEASAVSVSGTTVTLIPEMSLIADLAVFSQNVSSPSQGQTYRLSGVNLKGAISITAPANFELSSDDGTTWLTEVSLEPVDRSLTNASVLVRLNASALGSYSGDITHASTDVTNVTLAVSGETIPDPGITVTGNLTAFTSNVGRPSAAQSYTIEGANLAGNVAVTVPNGYEVSFNGELWLTSLTLVPADGNLGLTTLQIRLNVDAAGQYDGNVVHSSDGIDAANLVVTGLVDSTPLAIGERLTLNLWPNPSTEKVVLTREDISENGMIFIYNVSGVVVANFAVDAGNDAMTMDVSHLINGLYIVEYLTANEKTTMRLMKR